MGDGVVGLGAGDPRRVIVGVTVAVPGTGDVVVMAVALGVDTGVPV